MPCPNDHRERSVTVDFRMTPEQKRWLDRVAEESGISKQDTRFAAGTSRNRREFVMKTSENRSEQDAKIIGMSRPTALVVGRRRAPEPTEDVLSEPLMDVQGS